MKESKENFIFLCNKGLLTIKLKSAWRIFVVDYNENEHISIFKDVLLITSWSMLVYLKMKCYVEWFQSNNITPHLGIINYAEIF